LERESVAGLGRGREGREETAEGEGLIPCL
jgi:hypothetical protein